MDETLYIQTKKNVKVRNHQVLLQDIAQIFCKNPDIGERCGNLQVVQLPQDHYGQYKIDIIDLVKRIQEKEIEVEITQMGETEVVVSYESSKKKNKFWSWTKTIFVCVLTFFGSMFSIMTFQTDVDIPGLFQNIYYLFTGTESNGFTVLEISYALGIGIGSIVFFNHFGKWKLNQEPTPIEVEMYTYEDQVNDTILKMENRKGS